MPSVSIVIPAHNAAAFVSQTIKSVQAQTFEDWELFIIDDGSQDETASITQSFLTDARVHYIHQENQERSVARNRGISLSSGTYVGFLDADDLWHPEKLREQFQVMNAHPEIGMCYTFAAVLPANSQRARTYAQPMAKEGQIIEDLLRGNFITISSTIVRRDVLDRVGMFDTNPSLLGSEDWDLWLRISRHYPVGLVRKYLTTYRAHPGLQSHSKIFTGALGVLAKHYSDRDFVNSTPVPRDRALSYAYLSAAGFSAANLRRSERTRLFLNAVRLYWGAPFTASGAATIARIMLPDKLVHWLQESRAES